MASKKLVVVFTATGDQGRSIVSELAKDGKYAVRALTRNPSSPAAQKLAAQGAEVVECSLDSDTDVQNAVKGAWAIFANSDFFSTFTVEAEAAQGRRIIAAASQEPGLEIFIQSCFPPVLHYTNNTCTGLQHYLAKNEITRINREEYPALWAKTTQVFVGYYYSNWTKFAVFGPRKATAADGSAELVQSIPYPGTTPLACFDNDDMGLVIAAILEKPQAFLTKIVACTGEWINDNDKLASMSKALNIKTHFNQISPEEYIAFLESTNAFPPHIVQDISDQMRLVRDFGLVYMDPKGPYGVIDAKDILPAGQRLTTWEEWMKKADWSPILSA